MIKKTLVFATLLTVMYSLVIAFVKPDFYIPQTQFQENIIKAQEYSYHADNKNYVIVGSSLSTKLDMSELPDNFYNLSFRGMSIYDGLELIKQSGRKPSTIFIETNRYFKDIDNEFTRNVSDKGFFTLKEQIPALQEKNRPVNSLNLMACYVLEKVNKNMADKLKSKLGVKPKTHSEHRPSGFSWTARLKKLETKNNAFKEILKNQAVQHRQIPVRDTLDRRIMMLHKYVSYFREQNVQVVFFEMPVEASLCSAPRSIFLRDYLYKNFPANTFQHISLPDCTYFSTKDGIHLDDESASFYTQFLAQEINKLAPNKVVHR